MLTIMQGLRKFVLLAFIVTVFSASGAMAYSKAFDEEASRDSISFVSLRG